MNECSLCGLPATKWKWIPAGNDDGCIICQDCNPGELRTRIAELEADLAALRDRRCDGCANWGPDEHTYGWCETVLDEDNPIATRPDFACNRFLPLW